MSHPLERPLLQHVVLPERPRAVALVITLRQDYIRPIVPQGSALQHTHPIVYF